MANEEMKVVLEGLAEKAGSIVEMLKAAYVTEKGVDGLRVLLLTSGLAGMACHEAVKATDGLFEIVTTDNDKKFYFGNDVNHYLVDGEYSVLNFMNGIYKTRFPYSNLPDYREYITSAVQGVGNKDYRIAKHFIPAEIFGQVRSCWNGIFDPMTNAFCEDPTQWPLLYGIVLENIMDSIMDNSNADDVFGIALECMLFISKMDVTSI